MAEKMDEDLALEAEKEEEIRSYKEEKNGRK